MSSKICDHGRSSYDCRICKGPGICEHDRRRRACVKCNGAGICKHNQRKSRCKECGTGKELCKTPGCQTRFNSRYDGYCLPCAIVIRPDLEICRNYKTKERHVTDFIKEHFPDFDWVSDKKVSDGCSLRRPDYLCDFGSHIVIIEIDENQHTDYDTTCEHKRMMEISQDLGHRPIIFIRFNPDGYISQGKKTSSPWKIGKDSILRIVKERETEWNERLQNLRTVIQYWIDTKTEKTVETVNLFFDENESI